MSTLKTNNIQHVDRSEPSILIDTSGSVSIAGTLTYEDVTNVDSVGIITARGLSIFGNTTGLQVASGISTFQAVTGTTGTFSGAVSGTTGTFSGDIDIASSLVHTGDTDTKVTFTNDNIALITGGTTRVNITSGGNLEMPNDNDYIKIGAGADLQLVHTGSSSNIVNNTGHLQIQSNVTRFDNASGTEFMRILSTGALVVAGTSAYSDGTFGEAKLQFNTKTGNHIGACSVADTNNNITHVLFKNPTGAIASVGTHNSDFVVLTGNTERLRIDSVGGLLVAHTSSRNNFNSAASSEHAPIIQLEGTNQRRAISITSTNTSDGGMLILARQNGSPGANTVVSSGNQVGRIDFQGSGGTNMETVAQITAEVDGTPGDNDMPGRLLFKTTGDGANSASEKMRILSGGAVNIGGNFTQTSYGFSVRGGAVDQNVQFSNTKTSNGDIHYMGITLSNAGYGQALFGHTGHTTQSEQAAWMGMAGDDVAGGVGLKVFRGGTVIKKGQPGFQAYGGAHSTASGNYLIVGTEVFDTRGDYNASTGIFTAPIAGKYLFTINGIYTLNTSSATWKLTWHVNNSNSGVAAEWQTSLSAYNSIGSGAIIFNLAENDTVRLYVEGSSFHLSGIQSRFCGYLLG